MKKWQNQSPKRLHQSQIGQDVKQKIRTLSIMQNATISDVTERALVEYIHKNEQQLRQYHSKHMQGLK